MWCDGINIGRWLKRKARDSMMLKTRQKKEELKSITVYYLCIYVSTLFAWLTRRVDFDFKHTNKTRKKRELKN